MNNLSEYFKDLLNLLYPRACAACFDFLIKGEKMLCTKCLNNLPRTNFHDDSLNSVNQLFFGKVKLESATAFYYFYKGSHFQEMMHAFKYKGQKEIGYELGKMYGIELYNSEKFKNVNVIIPVPLHPSRIKKRGYNQSEWIAKGIAESMNVPVDTTSLIRSVATQTQTKKNITQRWENVKSIFQLTDKENLKGKHVLLIDDVITTGSTLEACAHAILSVPSTKVSVASLAVAKY